MRSETNALGVKIYISHAKKLDYINDLYNPIRNSTINKTHRIHLPHEKHENAIDSPSKDIIKDSDIFIAETSFRATWLWIELGWANSFWVKIICIHKKWVKQSWSLKVICNNFIEYSDSQDLIQKLETLLKSKNK